MASYPELPTVTVVRRNGETITTLRRGKFTLDGVEFEITPDNPVIFRAVDPEPNEIVVGPPKAILAGVEGPPAYEVEFRTYGARRAV
jgi:hypothetical protein